MKTTKCNERSQKPAVQEGVANVMFDALVCLEEKLLALQTLDDFDREVFAIIAPALNAARGVPNSHSADLEVES